MGAIFRNVEFLRSLVPPAVLSGRTRGFHPFSELLAGFIHSSAGQLSRKQPKNAVKPGTEPKSLDIGVVPCTNAKVNPDISKKHLKTAFKCVSIGQGGGNRSINLAFCFKKPPFFNFKQSSFLNFKHFQISDRRVPLQLSSLLALESLFVAILLLLLDFLRRWLRLHQFFSFLNLAFLESI